MLADGRVFVSSTPPNEGDRATVSVVIPHAGELRYLRACLESAIAEQCVSELILVMPDDLIDSRDIAQTVPGVHIVTTPELQGYGSASNLGGGRATGSLLLVLNDDTAISPGALDVLADFMRARPDVAACGPPLSYPDGLHQPSVFRDIGLRSALEAGLVPFLRGPLRRVRQHPRPNFPTEPTRVDWLSGAALMVRKSSFDAIGGFDDRLQHGLEDADLCRRLRGAGEWVYAVPSPPVIHVMGASGYGSRDPERARHTLIAGMSGWCFYSRRYHGRIRRRLQQAALLGFVVSRLGYALLRDRLGTPRFVGEKDAYRAAAHHVLHDAW